LSAVELPLVRDVIQPVITIDPEASVGAALATMRDHEVRHLPVVDAAGHLVGIVTDRDVRDAILGPTFAAYLPPRVRARVERLAERLEDVRVREVMTWSVITIPDDAPLAQAAAVMFSVRVGSLPVMRQGNVVGIVTERDVLKALAATLPSVRGADPDDYFW
jgi:acetoin utilization protein AcuB